MPPVLLIDEIDRADEEFEAFLLEILSDFQVTVPEIGTIRAQQPPRVVLTSNRTREVHDALKRRCLYHWIDYPTAEKEYAIVQARLPGMDATAGAGTWSGSSSGSAQVDLTKLPGCRGDARLGGRAGRAGRAEPVAGGHRPHAGRAAQVRGGRAHGPRAAGGGVPRGGRRRVTLPEVGVSGPAFLSSVLGFGRELKREGLTADLAAVLDFVRALDARGHRRPGGGPGRGCRAVHPAQGRDRPLRAGVRAVLAQPRHRATGAAAS